MELKIGSTIKEKDRLVKKIKARFGEGTSKEEEEENDEEEEEEQGQGPLALTQGMCENTIEAEDAEEKEEEEAPKVEPKKRKTQK